MCLTDISRLLTSHSPQFSNKATCLKGMKQYYRLSAPSFPLLHLQKATHGSLWHSPGALHLPLPLHRPLPEPRAAPHPGPAVRQLWGGLQPRHHRALSAQGVGSPKVLSRSNHSPITFYLVVSSKTFNSSSHKTRLVRVFVGRPGLSGPSLTKVNSKSQSRDH